MSVDFRYQVQQLQKLPENKNCVDCNAPNPQWASVSFGTFFCLECSGQHRSLGVHISFVRSVTMDSWKEDQMLKMKFGGNAKCKQFFQEYRIDGMPIKQKYYTPAASLYKEKLMASVEGRTISLAPPSDELAVPNLPQQAMSTGGMSSISSLNTSSSNDSSPVKSKNEAYFAQKGMENVNRPEGIAPSQGGKYAGFGSDYLPPQQTQGNDMLADTFSSLSKGWSIFAAKATEVAKVAAIQAGKLGNELNENVIKPTAAKIQDPNFRQNVASSVQNFGKHVAETSEKSISYISASINGTHQNGYNQGEGDGGEFRQSSYQDHQVYSESTIAAVAAPPQQVSSQPAPNVEAVSNEFRTEPAVGSSTMPKTTPAQSGGEVWSNVKDDEWASF